MAPTSAFLLVTIGIAFPLIHAQQTTRAIPTCGLNEQYTTCGSSCPPKCNPDVKLAACNKMCKEGCFCKEGYILDDSGDCITKTECNSCKGNTTYVNCGSSCPATCSSMNDKEVACLTMCNAGCFCKKGYVFLNDKNGPCVLPQDCPSTTTN